MLQIINAAPQLQNLAFKGVPLSKSLLTSLSQMPHLRTLRMEDCSFDITTLSAALPLFTHTQISMDTYRNNFEAIAMEDVETAANELCQLLLAIHHLHSFTPHVLDQGLAGGDGTLSDYQQ